MSVVAILRAAPCATNAESMEPESVTHHEMYARDALHPMPGRELTDIPLRIDHIKEVSVGRVTGLRVDTCVGAPRGMWHYVHVEISDPPGWLRRGTPVSISRAAYRSRTPWDADWLLVQKAILTEVSILSPGKEPAHPAACVEWMGESAAPKPREAQRLPAMTYAPVVTRTKRDLDESDELRRRIDWLEGTGRSPDFELVLTNLQDELNGRSLEREHARALARGGVVGVR